MDIDTLGGSSSKWSESKDSSEFFSGENIETAAIEFLGDPFICEPCVLTLNLDFEGGFQEITLLLFP